MPTTIRYRLLPGTFPKNAATVAKLTPLQYTAFIHRTLEKARSNVVERTSRGWSGQLASGYQTEVRRRQKGPIGILSNPTIYHDVQEEGRHPGKRPPTAALIPWVGSKLGIPPGPEREAVAFLVARKIGQQGYPGQHMVAEGWDETRKQIAPELKGLGLRIVAKLT